MFREHEPRARGARERRVRAVPGSAARRAAGTARARSSSGAAPRGAAAARPAQERPAAVPRSSKSSGDVGSGTQPAATAASHGERITGGSCGVCVTRR